MTLSTMTFSIMILSIMTLSITTFSIMTLSILTLSILTLSILTLSIMTLGIMTLSITTFNIMSLSITTLSRMGLVKTLSIGIQHNCIECHYAECRDYLHVILSVVRLNVFMLSVVAPVYQASLKFRGKVRNLPFGCSSWIGSRFTAK
jgi:hypothetical protein